MQWVNTLSFKISNVRRLSQDSRRSFISDVEKIQFQLRMVTYIMPGNKILQFLMTYLNGSKWHSFGEVKVPDEGFVIFHNESPSSSPIQCHMKPTLNSQVHSLKQCKLCRSIWPKSKSPEITRIQQNEKFAHREKFYELWNLSWSFRKNNF